MGWKFSQAQTRWNDRVRTDAGLGAQCSVTAGLPESSNPGCKWQGRLVVYAGFQAWTGVTVCHFPSGVSRRSISGRDSQMDNSHAIVSTGREKIQDISCKVRDGFIFPTLIAAFCSVFFTAGVAADELSLLVNGKAIHVNAPAGKDLNESNWGAGFQYDWAPIDAGRWVPFAMASGFSDSNRNPSYYSGGGLLRRYETDNGWRADIGVIGFVMTRKNYKDDKPFLGVLPAFSVGTKRFAVNMTYIPKVDPKMVALFFFQLKVNLDSFR
ncbi:MAG: hypothetical protein ACYC9K_12325 [Sulfuricaulis sp.]